eukprot:4416975-Heterocapsa_arctica.AAC.1
MSAVLAEGTKKKVKQEIDWDILKQEILDRSQWSYKKWGPAIIKRLAMYCDTQLRFTADARVWASKDEASHMLEFGWDLQVTSLEPDYVAQTEVQLLFNKLVVAYDEKNQRLRRLIHNITSGSSTIDWL